MTPSTMKPPLNLKSKNKTGINDTQNGLDDLEKLTLPLLSSEKKFLHPYLSRNLNSFS